MSEQDWIFSNLPPRYRALPTSPNVEDRRTGNLLANNTQQRFIDPEADDPIADPMLSATDFINPTGAQPGAYPASFNPNFAPPPQARWTPARPGGPPPSLALPYIDPHQSIGPGPAGWNPHGDSPMWSPFTPEQMNSALQYWQAGAQ